MDEESRFPVANITLDADEASTVAGILLRLAALIDPDDPDGPRNAHGQRSEAMEAQSLTHRQFILLRKPPYAASQRADVATRLRVISAKIEGQLPGEAPEVMH